MRKNSSNNDGDDVSAWASVPPGSIGSDTLSAVCDDVLSEHALTGGTPGELVSVYRKLRSINN